MALTAAGQWTERVSESKHVWGVRAGGRVNDMALSHDGYGKYEHGLAFGPSGGLYARHRLVGQLSLRTDVMYAVRGMDLHWCDVQYAMEVPYLDFRPMLQFNLSRPWWEVIPYVTVGMECSLTLPGKITYASNSIPLTSIALNQSNITTYDLGLWAGVGLDFHLQPFYRDVYLMIEAGADLGLLNNFTAAEQAGDAHVLNPDIGGTQNMGSRTNRGIEVTVGLGIPIVKKRPTVKVEDPTIENYQTKEEKYAGIELPNDTVVPSPDSMAATFPKRMGWDYEYKECYTLEEILSMIDHKIDVCNLRICLFDINFAFDSYELTLGSKRRLDQVEQMLREHPEYSIQINGHTDSIGTDEYNDRLSFHRASEVAGYFMRKGIRSSRMIYVGFGERYPIDTNGTEAGRYRNRRVEMELYCTGEKPMPEPEDDEEDNEK